MLSDFPSNDILIIYWFLKKIDDYLWQQNNNQRKENKLKMKYYLNFLFKLPLTFYWKTF